MEQELISKRELLQTYAISYGALYRWKRKGLIPEEWFIKKSTVTGQETFFPKEEICKRVELILQQKNDLSLDELSSRLSTEAQKEPTLTVETIYGKTTFYVKDIQSLILETQEGECQNMTHLVKGETR